jgi:antitoxin component of RelBE/YafQ-DinJ toxin-antitoxin module
MSEVVSVRIKKETKEALEQNGIDISLATRAYLEKLAWKSTSKNNLRELHKLIERKVKPSRKGFSVKSIREDRNSVQ